MQRKKLNESEIMDEIKRRIHERTGEQGGCSIPLNPSTTFHLATIMNIFHYNEVEKLY